MTDAIASAHTEPVAGPRPLPTWICYSVGGILAVVSLLLPEHPATGEESAAVALFAVVVVVACAVSARVGIAAAVLSFQMTNLWLQVGPLVVPLVDIVAIGLALGTLLRWVSLGAIPRPTQPFWWYIAFLAASTLSAFLSQHVGESLHTTARFLAFDGLVYLGFVLPAIEYEGNDSWRRGIVLALLVITIVELVLAYYRIAIVGDLWSKYPIDAWPFAAVHEAVALQVALLWPWLSQLRREASQQSRSWYLLAEVAAVGAVFVAFAKTAWLILVTEFLVIMVLQRAYAMDYRQLFRRVLFWGSLLPCVLLALATGLTYVDAGSIEERTAMALAGFEYWSQRPLLGFGPGAMGRLLHQSSWALDFLQGGEISDTGVHGFIFRLLPEVGLVGLLLLFVFLGSVAVFVIGALRERERTAYQRIATAFAVLAGSLVELTMGTDLFTGKFWLTLCFILVTARQARTETSQCAA